MTTRRTLLTGAALGAAASLAAVGTARAGSISATGSSSTGRFASAGAQILDQGTLVSTATSPSEADLLVAILNAAAAGGNTPSPTASATPTPESTPTPTISSGTGMTRPTGPGYTRFEDLYRTGDTVSAACARLTSASVITFGVGVFEFSDFGEGYLTGFNVPKQCRGIWGSGPGDLTGTGVGTYFRMKPMTSSKRSMVPSQSSHQPVPMRLMRSGNSVGPQSFGQFQVQGTEQGHLYHGLTVSHPGAAVDLTDILSTGWAGDANSPPGETFGVEVLGAPNHTMTRVEADGRRADGVRYGAAPLTAEACGSGTWRDCHGHHAVASTVTFWEVSNLTTYNLRSEYNGTGSGQLSGGGINHERCTGITHVQPYLGLDRTNGNTGVHVSFSNDTYSGPLCGATTNGSLTVQSPSFSDAFGNGLLYVQTWTPYGNGDSQVTPPTVRSGSANLPYEWIHGQVRRLVS